MKLNILMLSICVSLTFANSVEAAARRTPKVYVAPKLEDLPKIAIDTIATSDRDTKIIIFSNNTWEYYRPGMSKFDNLKIYQEHWDTTQVFAYKSVELSNLPAIIDLKLISDLNDFHTPIMGKVLSKYGPRGRRNHNGVDIPLKMGEPIYAMLDGKVRYAKYNTGGFGNLVIVRHANGLETWSAHLSKLNVSPNDYVKAGQIIGFGGSTGRSRGPHLHFEMRYSDQTFDPQFLVDFETGHLRYQTFALEKSFFNIHSRASDQLEEDDDYIFDNMNLLADGSDTDSTSTDILERIAKAQQSPKTTAKAPSISQSGAVYHTIRSGDILGKLAIRYGVSIDQICRLNKISRTTTLRLGQKLRVK